MKANWTWPSVACLAAVATLWLARADTHAQNRAAAAARPVGVVDIEKLFNQYKQTTDLDAILQERGQALTAEGKQKQAALTQASSAARAPTWTATRYPTSAPPASRRSPPSGSPSFRSC